MNKAVTPGSNLPVALPDKPDEGMPAAAIAARSVLFSTNAGMTTTWNVLCAFQMAYMIYLFLLGPITAALWVYPVQSLRQAFPSWIEGVVTLGFWSLFWNTTVLLMACFKTDDGTGTMIMTALNFLAVSSVKFAFDFSGLVKAAAGEAANNAAKMMNGKGQNQGNGGEQKGAGGEKGGGKKDKDTADGAKLGDFAHAGQKSDALDHPGGLLPGAKNPATLENGSLLTDHQSGTQFGLSHDSLTSLGDKIGLPPSIASSVDPSFSALSSHFNPDSFSTSAPLTPENLLKSNVAFPLADGLTLLRNPNGFSVLDSAGFLAQNQSLSMGDPMQVNLGPDTSLVASLSSSSSGGLVEQYDINNAFSGITNSLQIDPNTGYYTTGSNLTGGVSGSLADIISNSIPISNGASLFNFGPNGAIITGTGSDTTAVLFPGTVGVLPGGDLLSLTRTDQGLSLNFGGKDFSLTSGTNGAFEINGAVTATPLGDNQLLVSDKIDGNHSLVENGQTIASVRPNSVVSDLSSAGGSAGNVGNSENSAVKGSFIENSAAVTSAAVTSTNGASNISAGKDSEFSDAVNLGLNSVTSSQCSENNFFTRGSGGVHVVSDNNDLFTTGSGGGNVLSYNNDVVTTGSGGGNVLSYNNDVVTTGSGGGNVVSYNNDVVTTGSGGGNVVSYNNDVVTTGSGGGNTVSYDNNVVTTGSGGGNVLSYNNDVVTTGSGGGNTVSYDNNVVTTGSGGGNVLSYNNDVVTTGSGGGNVLSSNNDVVTTGSDGGNTVSYDNNVVTTGSGGGNVLSYNNDVVTTGSGGGNVVSYNNDVVTTGSGGGNVVSYNNDVVTTGSGGGNVVSYNNDVVTTGSGGGNVLSYNNDVVTTGFGGGNVVSYNNDVVTTGSGGGNVLGYNNDVVTTGSGGGNVLSYNNDVVTTGSGGGNIVSQGYNTVLTNGGTAGAGYGGESRSDASVASSSGWLSASASSNNLETDSIPQSISVNNTGISNAPQAENSFRSDYFVSAHADTSSQQLHQESRPSYSEKPVSYTDQVGFKGEVSATKFEYSNNSSWGGYQSHVETNHPVSSADLGEPHQKPEQQLQSRVANILPLGLPRVRQQLNDKSFSQGEVASNSGQNMEQEHPAESQVNRIDDPMRMNQGYRPGSDSRKKGKQHQKALLESSWNAYLAEKEMAQQASVSAHGDSFARKSYDESIEVSALSDYGQPAPDDPPSFLSKLRGASEPSFERQASSVSPSTPTSLLSSAIGRANAPAALDCSEDIPCEMEILNIWG